MYLVDMNDGNGAVEVADFEQWIIDSGLADEENDGWALGVLV